MGKSKFGLHSNVGPSFVGHKGQEQSKTETSTNRDANGIKHNSCSHCLWHRPWPENKRDRISDPTQPTPTKPRQTARDPDSRVHCKNHNTNQKYGAHSL